MTSAVVVDDSPFMRKLITRTLEDGGVAVAGTAADGSEALDAIKRHEPDVVTMDVEMPNVDGLEAVDRIMAERPTPTLMLSAYTDETADVSLEALDRGAVDVYLKPGGEVSTAISSERDLLVEKVQSVAAAEVERFDRDRTPAKVRPGAVDIDRPRTVIIGASTGGPRIVKEILASLPDVDCRILVVQHMPSGFTSRFAERLDTSSAYHVEEVEDRAQLDRGTVAVAPGDAHLEVTGYTDGRVTVETVDSDERTHSIVPAVDRTMRTAAAVIDDPVIGVLLSGMGDDGVAGLREIRRAGGYAIAQSENDCAVFGMPRRAIERGHVDAVCDIGELPGAILGEVGA